MSVSSQSASVKSAAGSRGRSTSKQSRGNNASSQSPGSKGGSRTPSRSRSRGMSIAAKKVLNAQRSFTRSPSQSSQAEPSSVKSGFSMTGSNDYSEEGKRTTLHFIFLDGQRETIHLEKRPRTYWDLQQVIITKKPKCKKMFAIRNDKKQFVTSKNYAPQDELFINEIITSINMKNHPLEEARWEFYKYHAKPRVFHDRMEERLKLKQAAELEAKLAAEEEERQNAEFLKHKDQNLTVDLGDDI